MDLFQHEKLTFKGVVSYKPTYLWYGAYTKSKISYIVSSR
jgi:hypothetical protein